jgi:3,5-dihydroxyphenylacetyl-CoA synthase
MKLKQDPKEDAGTREGGAWVLSVGLAVPPRRFRQQELAELLGPLDEKGARFFQHEHIAFRHLALPEPSAEAPALGKESTGELLARFKEQALLLGRQAAEQALGKLGLAPGDIGLLCCVTSTGFLVPGLSALLHQEMGFRGDCSRFDIVGMGCNAGLNGMQAADFWCKANPGRYALLLCVEVCSAIYCLDGSENSALVNSLFGDGAAAAVLVHSAECEGGPKRPLARVKAYSSQLIPDTLQFLRFDWDDEHRRFRFFVGKDTPALLASGVKRPLGALAREYSFQINEVRHWIVHSGGAAILDKLQAALGLDGFVLRHTRSVLRDFGNVSSGSFLFSFLRLVAEGEARPGDLGILMTMGPGLTIETALVHF